MYSKDDYLHNLNRPVMMSAEDDEDELFKDDEIDGSGPLNDDDLSPSDTATSDAPDSDSSTARNSSGITRSAMGFGLLAFAGLLPLTLLILYMINVGLSFTALLFTGAFLIGLVLSIWTFMYYRKGNTNFSKFEVHSFFSWTEIAVISVVLLGLSFMNLSSLHSGHALRLSAESTIQSSEHPEPIFAPEPPKDINLNTEENEVLYQSKDFAPINGQVKSQEPKKISNPIRNKVRVVRPYQQPIYKKVAPIAVLPVVKTQENNENVGTSTHHEDEEARSSSGQSLNQVVDDAVNMVNTTAKEYTPVQPKTEEPVKSVVHEEAKPNMEVETSPFVSTYFLGGVLASALGYALALALAGALLGLLRKFDNPFAAKTKELINEETGEITLETEALSMGKKIADYVFRAFIGFNMGGTVGFILGLAITLPLYFFFWDKAQTEPVVASFLTSLGVVKNPDLAYATGLIVAGLMVPFTMLIVGKASPAGRSLSEAEVRQVYSVPVVINKTESSVAAIPEPAIISFADPDESDDSGMIVDDFSDDPKESLTTELAEEFGLDLEDTFGMKVSLPVKSNGNGNGKVSSFEKQKVTSILENSLGELGNVTVQVSAELGKATIMLTDWLNLSEGMLIELDKPVSEEIDILINDVCKGKGKLAVTDNHLSVKVSKSNFAQSKN